jgi:hypothetical protein
VNEYQPNGLEGMPHLLDAGTISQAEFDQIKARLSHEVVSVSPTCR